MHRLIAMLLIYCTAAGAATVFRSVDENGVVTFSDTPPEADVPAETVMIDVPPPQDPEQYQENLESMRETTDRMAADRREREKHRAEMRELTAKTRAQEAQAQQQPAAYSDYYPVYRSRRISAGYRPPMRPGYRPRPEHPIAHPPLRPGHGSGTYGSGTWTNSQLMRPMVTSRP